MKITNDTYTELLEYLGGIFDDGSRFVAYLEAYQQGTVSREDFENACNEIFTESKSILNGCNSQVINILLHLFKIAFGTDSSLHSGWVRDIVAKHRPPLMDDLNWDQGPQTSMINKVIAHLPISNARAIHRYKELAKLPEYSDLKDGVSRLPTECPFTLKQLLEDDVQVLVSRLRRN